MVIGLPLKYGNISLSARLLIYDPPSMKIAEYWKLDTRKLYTNFTYECSFAITIIG